MNPAIKTTIGIFLVMLGIIGLFLPVLQGILLILLGVFMVKNRDLTYADMKQRFKSSFLREKVCIRIR